MLDHLKLLYVFLFPGAPDRGRIFQQGSDIDFIRYFFNISVKGLMIFRIILPFAEIFEMCLFQERSSEILIPRYFAFLVVVCKVILCRT